MFLLNQTTHRMLIQHDADVGHRFVPNLRARVPHDDGGSYYVVTNSDGFRSDFEFAARRNGHGRILMYGDSYTAGDCVSNPDRFSDQLARMTDTEVYNYGVPGTGTDQHLLIQRKFGRRIEADLVILCVQIDSFHRIKVSHRPAIDRILGRRVLVPKPYFELDRGDLVLRHVPVPKERPADNGHETGTPSDGDAWVRRIQAWSGKVPGLHTLRRSALLERLGSRLISAVHRVRAAHPYPDILSADTPGWQLMEAIVRQFIAEAKPLPVVVVPIPTKDFYQVGMKPVYQKLFAALDSPADGVHVCDVSTPLVNLPWSTRQKLTFDIGGHFTPMAGRLVAEMLAEFIQARQLLSPATVRPPAQPREAITTIAARRTNASYVLGISCFYHNSATALIRDGEIVAAAEEERFTRLKNDRRFPRHAVNYCLEEAGISQGDLSAVAFYDNSALTFERLLHSLMAVDKHASAEMWHRILPSWLSRKLQVPNLLRTSLGYTGPILQGMHHRSHAASAFFPSPFERAAILTIDGVGEWATASIGRGEGRRVELLKEMRFPHSLGLLYSAFTYFTGFKVNSGEYKMMGLAPYGRPVYAQRILDHLVDLKADGSLELNLEYFAFLREASMTSSAFDRLFEGPRRKPENPITRREIDLACSIQTVIEEAILRMSRTAHTLTYESRLCLAGGVALNCVANGRVLREGPFEDLWIQPAAGDSGGSLGVALDVWHTFFGHARTRRVPGQPAQGGSCLGPSFSGDEIESYLETFGYPYQKLTGEARNRFLSRCLREGKVVGHFAGRLEFGPRALGARSILGDPRDEQMQPALNLRIKYRESFRPFAPAVLAEHASEFFEIDRESPYMLIVAPVREERRLPFDFSLDEDANLLSVVRRPRSDVPAVTHVDYSARIQTVRRDHHPEFYDLIRQFQRDTGCPLVVNTSFNVRGEPIVCTPQDAYRCFMRTEMDVLALGDCILLKPGQPAWPEGKGEGLEPEDATGSLPEAHPRQLRAALDQIFERQFWPAAEQLRAGGQVLIGVARPASAWVDANEPADLKPGFTIAPSLQSEVPEPRAFARDLVRNWRGPEAARALEPIVAALLKAGRKHHVKAEIEEPVPESVYAMF